MKFKVVIIDDKPLIRKSLIQTINWEKLNCQVAGEAQDGLEAKEIIEFVRPDLIISDIKMPGLDGLSLTEYVKKILPDTKVIIITGYQEFEYAKKALQLGVYDLVLKPIDNRAMEAIIKKALGQILTRMEKEEYQKKLLAQNDYYKNEMNSSLEAVQGQFLLEVIKGRREVSKIGKKELVNLKLEQINFSIVIVRARTSDKESLNLILNELVLLMKKHNEACDEGFRDMMVGKDLVFVTFHKKGKSAREHRVQMKNSLYSINKSLEKKYGFLCCFAVSQITNDVGKIAECYNMTLEMLNERYFLAEENILFLQSHTMSLKPDSGYIIRELDRFYNELEYMDNQVLEAEVFNIITKIVEETKGNEFRIKCLLSEICLTLLRHYSKELDAQEGQNNTNRIMEEINILVDVRESRIYLHRFILNIKENLNRRKHGNNPLAAGALEYIEKNYSQNISLTQVADSLSANSSYLSRLLKKETGKNFVDILANYRISMAKQLLNEPGSKVLEVCEQVGYSDYAYFYQVFKRVEGISPSEYKKKGKKI